MRTTLLALLIRTLLFLAFVQVLPSQAGEAGDDHVASREIYRDTTGKLSLKDVLGAPFVAAADVFAGGYTSDAIWVRLVVRPPKGGGALVLRILPTYLNEITLYEPDPDQPGTWRTTATGNRVPWRDRPLKSISLGFPVHPVVESTYYLRLRTASSSLLEVRALTTEAASRKDVTDLLWQALYLSLIVGVVFWALHDYWLTKDRVILVFSCVYMVYLFYVLAILGYLAPIFPQTRRMPEITSWSVVLLTFTILYFHKTLLSLFDVNRPARWGLKALLGIVLVVNGLMLAGKTAVALNANSLIGLLAAPMLFFVALTARKDAAPGRLMLKVYYGLLCIALMTYFAPTLGLSSASIRTLYGALFQGMVSALLFGNLLHARARQLHDEQNRAQQAIRLNEYQLDAQKEQLAEQGRFMAMLAHELKNPLAAIRLNVDTLQQGAAPADRRYGRISRALDDIDALVERCLLSDRVEQGMYEIREGTFDVASLITEWQQQHPADDRLSVSSDPSVGTLTSDPQLLAVAIANLLDNAVKYSPPGSPIEAGLHAAPGSDGRPGIRIEISNLPGPAGFPDGERAFEKYHRGAATSRHNGTGLGLFLVKGIAERLGAEVHYQPRPDRVVFSLWLPRSRP